MNRLLTILTLVVAALMHQGCVPSYKLNGSAIDYTVYRTVHVGEFPIRAALVYSPLQQMFENDLLDYITRNTRLQTIDEDAYASKTRLTITVRVKYTDSKKEGNDINQTFSAYRDFDASQMLNDVQEQLCQEISKELVELIFNATLGNW